MRCLEILFAWCANIALRGHSSWSADRPVERSPHLVVGVTGPENCLLLRGRLRAMREAGFRVTLIAGPGRLPENIARSEGVEFRALPMERRIAPCRDLVSFLRLCFLLWRLRPDVTEFSTPKAGLLGSVAARCVGVPARVYMLRGLRLEAAQGAQRRILLMAEKVAAASAHTVLCNSESLRRQALNLGLAPAGKLRLLGNGSSNGVDTERFSPGKSDIRARLGLAEDAPVVGFVGRLTYAKGLPDLVEAFERILEVRPTAHLLLAGWFDAAEDGLSRSWRRRIEEHPRIHVSGMVGDTAPWYRAMDLLVLPTWREGFPNAVLEAAASGVPAITTLATGAVDSVASGVTGILIPPGYPSAIQEAVLDLMADPERRQRMGEAARARACACYSSRHVLRLTIAFYRDQAQRGRPRFDAQTGAERESVLNPA